MIAHYSPRRSDALSWSSLILHTHGAQTYMQPKHPNKKIMHKNLKKKFKKSTKCKRLGFCCLVVSCSLQLSSPDRYILCVCVCLVCMCAHMHWVCMHLCKFMQRLILSAFLNSESPYFAGSLTEPRTRLGWPDQ